MDLLSLFVGLDIGLACVVVVLSLWLRYMRNMGTSLGPVLEDIKAVNLGFRQFQNQVADHNGRLAEHESRLLMLEHPEANVVSGDDKLFG